MRRLTFLIAFAVAASSCAGGEVVGTTTTPEPAPSTTTQLPEPRVVATERDLYHGLDESSLPEGMTLVAMTRGAIDVFARPGDTEATMTLPAETLLGTTTVLTVLEGPVGGWARVMLPIRPNGSAGWIEIAETDLFVVEGRIVVDLSDRELTVYRGNKVVLKSAVAVGTSRNPTPTGNFFVTDNVTMTNPSSPWGPNALGLSGRSDTISEYNGGDGIIGIHGTNRPGSIGNAASLGCVRLPNDVITLIHDLIPIGTPVEIRA